MNAAYKNRIMNQTPKKTVNLETRSELDSSDSVQINDSPATKEQIEEDCEIIAVAQSQIYSHS